MAGVLLEYLLKVRSFVGEREGKRVTQEICPRMEYLFSVERLDLCSYKVVYSQSQGNK